MVLFYLLKALHTVCHNGQTHWEHWDPVVLPEDTLTWHLSHSCLIHRNDNQITPFGNLKTLAEVHICVIIPVQCLVVCCVSRMAVDGGHRDSGCDWDGRWNHVRKFLERPGPFTHPDFEPSTEVTETLHVVELELQTEVQVLFFNICVSLTKVSTVLVGEMQDTGHWCRRTRM